MARMLVTPSSAKAALPPLSSPLSPPPSSHEAPRALPGAAASSGSAAAGVPLRRTAGMRHPIRLPFALFAVTLLLIVLRQAKLVEIFFPLGAFGVALLLYRRSPAHYLGFVCWLFFLSPEVRRLADFANGSFNQQSPVMIAPLLAVSLSGFTLIRNFRILGERRAAPLVMIMLALFYSFVIGMAAVGPAAALYTLINWMFPVLVAFHLVATWRDYPVYHRVLLKTFVYAGFVMGLYGVIEFISPPPWDAFWLLSSQMTSEGEAVPFGMRIGSTMNSSGPFAMTIMSIMLLALGARGKMRIAMGIVGVPALMFTAVRGAWGGLMIGLIYPLVMLDGKGRLRLIAGLLGLAMLGAPVLMIDEVSEPLMKRFDTIQNISEDNSYQVRAEFYKQFFMVALSDIAGQGLGTTGLGTKLSADDTQQLGVVFDSGVMEVPYVMGWPGTLLYVGGVVLLMWRAFLASRLRSKDRLAISGVGVSLAIFAMMVFVNTLTGLPGMFFFIGVIMPVISLRHARHLHGPASAAPTPAPQPRGSLA